MKLFLDHIVIGFMMFLCAMQSGGAVEPFDYHSVVGRQSVMPREGLLEGESLPLQGKSRVQGLSHYGGRWSGGHHLLWDGRVGESMETSFQVRETGNYQLTMRMTKAPDYGIVSMSLNGRVLMKNIDLYATRVDLTKVLDLGAILLQEGGQKMAFTLTGANERAVKFRGQGYLMGLDYVKLKRLDPAPPQKEQKSPGPARNHVATLNEMQPVLEEYCWRCHGGDETKGKVNLKTMLRQEDFMGNIELTRKIMEALEFHEMPPDEEMQLPEIEHARLLGLFRSYIEDYLASTTALSPVIMRRLTRYEYNNAVRDLLQLKGDVYPLPEKTIRAHQAYFDPGSGRFADAMRVSNRALGKNQIEQHILSGVVPYAIDLPSEHGFNNRGDELSISPILLESFLNLGRSIVHSPEFDGYCQLTESFFNAPQGLDASQWGDLAEQRLGPFLERAFRGSIDDSTLERYARFMSGELDRNGSFTQSMKSVVTAILASPRFIFMLEDQQGWSGQAALTGYELAARLSFFLWSSLPDEELLAAARTGQILQREVLEAQVERMLEDRRSRALAENFARQWLRLDQLMSAVPDFERFEVYYSRRGCEQWKFGLQTMLEPLLLFESIMVEDRSIMLLIDSNYAYRSDELQSWYKDEIPFGKRPNRDRFNTDVQLYKRRSLDSRREGGVITTAAVLTMTSSPLRTSPITRGAWVASVILNRPPPPPPDVVPEIEADDAEIEAAGMTLRQRLKQHQVNPNCVSCHEKIDPFGFALENYDAVGRWRDTYRSGLPIDASGELFGQASFKDIVGLKDALLNHPEWFTRAFSEHLLSYALARKLDVTDQPAVDRIVRRVLADHGQFSTVVREIVLSYPFLNKSTQRAEDR